MHQHFRILIIDDDGAIQDFLSEALSFEGYDVAVASDGHAALSLIDNFAPNLILLDMLMPRMGGTDFITAYKALSHLAPIIGLSAMTTKEDYAKVLGIEDFLDKPFDLEDLLQRVESLIK